MSNHSLIVILNSLLLSPLVCAAENVTLETRLRGQVGSLDESFTPVHLDIPAREHWYGFNVRLQPDGKLLMLGRFETSSDEPGWLFRLSPDGTLDTGFSPQVLYGLAPECGSGYYDSLDVCSYGRSTCGPLCVQPDGRILVSYFPQPLGRAKLVRLLSDGMLDQTFASGRGQDLKEVPDRILMQSDGRIIIAQRLYRSNSVAVGLLRFNPDGSVDPSFNVVLAGAESIALALQPDGKLLVRGAFTSVNAVNRKNLVRLTSDGFIDPTFTPPALFDPTPTQFGDRALGLSRDGSVLVTVPKLLESGPIPTNLVRLKPNGEWDTSFTLKPTMYITHLFSQLGDGSWLAGVSDGAGWANFILVRADGSWEWGDFLPGHVLTLVPDGGVFALRQKGYLSPDFALELVRLRTVSQPLSFTSISLGSNSPVRLVLEGGVGTRRVLSLQGSIDLKHWIDLNGFYFRDDTNSVSDMDEWYPSSTSTSPRRQRFYRVPAP